MANVLGTGGGETSRAIQENIKKARRSFFMFGSIGIREISVLCMVSCRGLWFV